MITKIIAAIAYIILAPVAGFLFEGLDQKLADKLQHRASAPFMQPLCEIRSQFGRKASNREASAPNRFRVFCLVGHLVLTIGAGAIFFCGGDLLMVIFTEVTAIVLMAMAMRTSSGASRVSALKRDADLALLRMLAVLPMLLLAAVGFSMTGGSFAVSELAISARMAVLPLPGIFIGCLCTVMILLGKHPFGMGRGAGSLGDAADETNAADGTGVNGWLRLTGWYRMILSLGLLGLFFCNGTNMGFAIGAIVSIVAYFLMTIVGSRFAELIPRAAFRFAWIIAVAFGLVNLFELQLLL